MTTAQKKVDPGTPSAGAVRVVSAEASLAFGIYLANGGGYLWGIVHRSRETLAHLASFASQDEGERVARFACRGPGSARFEPHVAEEFPTVVV